MVLRFAKLADNITTLNQSSLPNLEETNIHEKLKDFNFRYINC